MAQGDKLGDMNVARLAALAAAAILTGCGSAPQKEVKSVEAPKPITGLSAIFRMYQLARTWAPDAMPLKAQSITLNEVKAEGGRVGAWSATFTSASRQKQKTYTYSAIEGEGLHKDVFAQQETSWAGPTRQSQPFRIEALKTDTDKAWETAAKQSEKYIKENPAVPVFFQVEWTERFPGPTWRVIWGESVSKSGRSVFVDTASGVYLQTSQ